MKQGITRISRKAAWPASAIVLSFLILAACADRTRLPVIRLALQTEPTTLDPVLAVDYSSGTLTSMIHSNLVRFDDRGKIIPALSKSWTISEDGLVYTFILGRSGFSNGRRVTSSDVLFSFKRLLDPATASPRWWVLNPLAGAGDYHRGGVFDGSSILAPDDSTVVLILDHPVAHFLSLLSMPPAGIVCEEQVRGAGVDYGRDPCGSGPWKLSAWREGDELVLDRNLHSSEYNRDVEGVSFRIIPESMTRIAEFETGSLDILEVPRAELDIWRSAGMRLLEKEELRVVYIGLNNCMYPFNDVRVRQALNHAIDVETIIARVLFGAAKRSCGPVPPGLKGNPRDEERYAYDPDKARDLLSSAGLEDGFTMEIWQRENPESGRILESVQGYLSRVGIDVKIVTREWGAFKEAVDKGTPDAFYLDWFADYPDRENFLTPLFHSANRGGGGNRSGYASMAVDSLLSLAVLCGDYRARNDIYRRAEKMIYDDAPWIFLWFPVRYEVVSYRLDRYEIPLIFTSRLFLETRFR
ncbi:MAG: ABC transporter substrate-binding protein [Candidatus Krumholzibacteriota bacterium]|nr:ABC transporter substrate-binding protein [Candidatus Krumholzibacteriota bacterium]